MVIASFLLNKLNLGVWPQALRKPVTLGLIRRKSLTKLPSKTRYHGLIYEGNAANLIDYHVLSRGSFEGGLTTLLIDWSKTYGAGIFLDVGANVGVHTLGAHGHYEKVFAIEPYPPIASRLRRSLEINCIDNVNLIEAALAEVPGETSFKVPNQSNLGTGRIALEGESALARECVRVRVLTGDHILSAEKLPLAAVKIDTEGAEPRVLAGLVESLKRDRPLVVTELLENSAEAASQMIDLLPGDYRCFQIDGIKTTRFRLRPWVSGAGDIVAIPAEKIRVLSPRILESLK